MASEREVLLLSVLKQLDLFGKIDFERLARDIDAPTSGAASKRCQRFKASLMTSNSNSTSPSKPSGMQKSKKRSPAEKVRWVKKELSDDNEKADDEIDESVQVPETPPRKMPAKKARVKVFKNESDANESDEYGYLEDEDQRCEEVSRLIDGVEEGSGSSD